MNTSINNRKWTVLKESVRGASHVRSGQPNQDFALEYRPTEEDFRLSSQLLMVAISDGHGSPKSFRSDIGSKKAGEVAMIAVAGCVRNLYDQLASHEAGFLSSLKREAEERLPQVIVKLWQHAIDEDIRRRPFTRTELERLEDQDGKAAVITVAKRLRLAYGSTLLIVILIDGALICMQLGDGDIIAVSDKEEAFRLMPSDPRLFANETTSLSNDDAWRDFRVTFHAISDSPPALIIVSTDGYSNSYATDQDFLSVGTNILAILRTKGVDAMRDSLKRLLSETSRLGSGDDITVAIICRNDIALPGTNQTMRGSAPSAPVQDSDMRRQPPNTASNLATKPLLADSTIPETDTHKHFAGD